MFTEDWIKSEGYFSALRTFSSLSGLFSESNVPYLDYRLAENLFCRYFNANNYARDCSAYDASVDGIGIGIKTFILKKNYSFEKIAEFNKRREDLDSLKNMDLAIKLAEFRNERIQVANDTYGTSNSLYHIVGRKENRLCIFNTKYRKIDIDTIEVTKENSKGIHFKDRYSKFHFNRSKTVLMMNFDIPERFQSVSVDIIKDPYSAILEMAKNMEEIASSFACPLKRGIDYVILPLYSTRSKADRKNRVVPTSSGLNQWNAQGRPRDYDEVYIPIPATIRHKCKNFFPDRKTRFILQLPDGSFIRAKVCQENEKALMSDPNKDLGKWILRKIMRKPKGDFVTSKDFDRLGFDSVCIKKLYKINDEGLEILSISLTESEYESYDDFIKFL